MLKIVIVDDHDIVRRGLRDLVAGRIDWAIVGEAADGREAVELITRLRPQIVVIDISLPQLNGIAVTRQITQAVPSLEVLIFSMHEDEETIRGALAAGARGYLLKHDADRNIVEAIEALAAHRPYFSDCVSEVLMTAALVDQGPSQLEIFTGREIQVAQLIAEGRSNKTIARDLKLSIKTVESHRAAAMRKAGVRSAPELVRFAVRHNLIRA